MMSDDGLVLDFDSKVQVTGKGSLTVSVPFVLARVLKLVKGDVVVWRLRTTEHGMALLMEKKGEDEEDG